VRQHEPLRFRRERDLCRLLGRRVARVAGALALFLTERRLVDQEIRALGGIQSLTVDYGLLTPQGYKPTVVRAFRIVPKPKIFGKNTVAQAWGPPDAIGKQNEQETFFYKSGLVVIFTKEGDDTVLMTFTPPQPDAPAPAAPRR